MFDTSTTANKECKSFKIMHQNTKQLNSPYQGNNRESVKMMTDRKPIGSSTENEMFKAMRFTIKQHFSLPEAMGTKTAAAYMNDTHLNRCFTMGFLNLPRFYCLLFLCDSHIISDQSIIHNIT